MIEIRHLPREWQGVLFWGPWMQEFLHSTRGAVFSCCALVRASPGDVLGLARTNPHRGGSK